MLNHSSVFFYVVYHPSGALEQFRTWLGYDCHYLSQKGNELGERLRFAFQTLFSEGFRQVIALASDVPDLCVSVITRAFQVLRTSDAIVGPSPDGGYYLIGFQASSFSSTIFDDISWSSDKVLPQTCAKLQTLGRSFQLLSPWRDVDKVTDLRALVRRNLNTDFRFSHTMTYLRPYYVSLLSERTRGRVT